MKDGERGGSMVWAAILMMAVPILIFALVNTVRVIQGNRALQEAADAACQTAAETGVDDSFLRRTGRVRFIPQVMEHVASSMFGAVLSPYVHAGLLAHPHLQIFVENNALRCRASSEYKVWGVIWVRRGYSLRVEAVSQARISAP